MQCKQRITGTERNAEMMCFKSKLKISGESLVLCIILLVEMCHGIFPEWNWILESHVCVLCEHEKVRESHFLHSITVFQFYGRHLNHFEPKMGVLVLKFWPSLSPPPLGSSDHMRLDSIHEKLIFAEGSWGGGCKRLTQLRREVNASVWQENSSVEIETNTLNYFIGGSVLTCLHSFTA